LLFLYLLLQKDRVLVLQTIEYSYILKYNSFFEEILHKNSH
jgi:hypothetical protein